MFLSTAGAGLFKPMFTRFHDDGAGVILRQRAHFHQFVYRQIRQFIARGDVVIGQLRRQGDGHAFQSEQILNGAGFFFLRNCFGQNRGAGA